MKTRFWIFIALLIFGAALAGYWSGHYEGVRTTRVETQQFLQDFDRSTDLESYLQQHGQQEWTVKLLVYGIAGPNSYFHSYNSSAYCVLAGIACVAVGIVGLSAFSRRQV